ncbi:hypothetical protein BXT86_06385 [candidate division WOR-3 bacterium 4484_100]|uniref:Permease n=1 Tax=candidate division WOR-3 bacterium 4484_100 TaxID=1936077 RepID=A0A1V4QDQ4_UNCW3|nr:MAG: hypothetical protein BXT86_06385 [candidate division WOR-3 bacterium 4484_100]
MRGYAKEKEIQRHGVKRDIIILGATLIIAIILLSIFPDKRTPVFTASRKFFIEMILILPAVMILMGLFSVFVPKEMIVKHLGKTAGIKAVFLGILMGALPTGPLYAAFPMASALLKKGAKISCIIAFLSAWACIKLPQEMIELQFLGFKFMVTRLVLTIIFVVVMGISIEWLIKKAIKQNQEVNNASI